jgi:protein gp37
MTIAYSKHIGLLCTKYTWEMAAYLGGLDIRTVSLWMPKLWLGFSAEDQEWFDRRWADIRPFAAAGWFVFVSISPMLGAVTLPPDFLALGKWVIVNGECEQINRYECRPMDADWARAIRDQCRAANIPFFMRAMHTGAYVPPDLHIRQFPAWP